MTSIKILEKIKYSEDQDGRRKIPTSMYEEIRDKYKSWESMRKVAAYYGVDKRLIQFIVYPDRLKHLQDHNREIKHYKKYYDTEKRRLYQVTYRARKRAILGCE